MEEMVSVAKKLRQEHHFRGYIHLKAVAGCADMLVQQAGLWADRLSANIELPTKADLRKLAPAKTHDEIESAMGTISAGIDASQERSYGRTRRQAFAPAGQSTQMMVGATATADGAILATASSLYRRFGPNGSTTAPFRPFLTATPACR